MKANRRLTAVVVLTSWFIASSVNAADHSSAGAEHTKAPGDIVAVASEAGSFKTLVAAVKAAGLVETLQGKGPFTVFAPTDQAFAKLPAGTLDDLLKPQNKGKLKDILLYHVVPGKVMAADVKTMKAKTAGGKELSIKVEGGKVTVDNAKVVKTDVPAKNGVIHVIDTVVLPK
ncbi:MAG TPA: fasciclin domain-containing protein [Verrucomicrobiota bacterium]|nr:fasciclin domain-containing protein [Verrucomicrobiota bacterium]HNU50934.1 fasciclin domain-containing protein [Verrucomicrobiota bacterium]